MIEQENKGESDAKKGQTEFTSSPFAKHFARHCRNATTSEEVLSWCTKNMKVKRQKVIEEDGAEDCLTRTVYQLSCKDCSVSVSFVFAKGK